MGSYDFTLYASNAAGESLHLHPGCDGDVGHDAPDHLVFETVGALHAALRRLRSALRYDEPRNRYVRNTIATFLVMHPGGHEEHFTRAQAAEVGIGDHTPTARKEIDAKLGDVPRRRYARELRRAYRQGLTIVASMQPYEGREVTWAPRQRGDASPWLVKGMDPDSEMSRVRSIACHAVRPAHWGAAQ